MADSLKSWLRGGGGVQKSLGENKLDNGEERGAAER